MSTEDLNTDTTQQAGAAEAPNLEAFLRDPLSMPEGTDLESLAGGDAAAGEDSGAAPAQGAQATPANKQGETNGDAPGTGTENGKGAGGEGTGGAAAGADDPKQSVVLSRDGKHVIPYDVLRQERERAARAELMAQDLSARLTAEQEARANGQASGVRSVDQIVDKDVLAQLREESPQVAEMLDKLIEQNKSLDQRVRAFQPAADEAERERQVQQVMTVEDAIAANSKLSHTRANDPEAFNGIASLDEMLRKQSAWKDKSMSERFDAAVRMYEAAHGDIVIPGTQQAQPNSPAAKGQPTDPARRVAEAVAKAAASTAGPSTLSDIPGGAAAPAEQDDAMAAMSSHALTQQFMDMTPEQIEAQLARLA